MVSFNGAHTVNVQPSLLHEAPGTLIVDSLSKLNDNAFVTAQIDMI